MAPRNKYGIATLKSQNFWNLISKGDTSPLLTAQHRAQTKHRQGEVTAHQLLSAQHLVLCPAHCWRFLHTSVTKQLDVKNQTKQYFCS